MKVLSRFMLSSAIVLSLLAVVVSFPSYDRRAAAPKALASPDSVRIGTLVAGAPVLFNIRVSNRSTRPLMVRSAMEFGCGPNGCIAGEPNELRWSEGAFPVVLPAASHRELQFIAKGVRPGPYARTLALFTNDPSARELRIPVLGYVIGSDLVINQP